MQAQKILRLGSSFIASVLRVDPEALPYCRSRLSSQALKKFFRMRDCVLCYKTKE